ncbi:MAG: hypothetical protein MUP48_00585 [Wolbachia endosymbiont of Homalodisca vitripennis]|nr:hypothetical protein [Wolbachia endosymbiont of Homalodisca vitripennis]MCJ7453949.1 hypothetical protein [Wolbachia endosymbiont of Homalodisca vitripennis]MCJ7476065.1 hypothetical protein [Wolbachia endosymbiont of Homalodisca vitripennis]
MFVCLKSRDSNQEEAFKEFYIELHEKYGFAKDDIDPGEVTTYDNLESSLKRLENLKIRFTIETYEEYESIVWGDVFAGKIIAQVGNIKLLHKIQSKCSKYPEKWRNDIIEQLKETSFSTRKIKQLKEIVGLLTEKENLRLSESDKSRLDQILVSFKNEKEDMSTQLEIRVLDEAIVKQLKKLNVTLLFEAFVTYLKVSYKNECQKNCNQSSTVDEVTVQKIAPSLSSCVSL